MPRVHFRSLAQQSLEIITSNINYSYTPVKTSTHNEEVKESELGIHPFHQLPTNLLEVIISNVNYSFFKNGMGKKAYSVLEYLISPQLEFASFCYYTEEYYLNIFPQFGKLISLTLSKTVAGDKSLEVIGIYCKNLRLLDLYKCCYVTDTGVRLLCFNYDEIGLGNQRPADLCKTLQHLMIHSTSVTPKGVLMAINNLTVLKYLDHERIFEVMLELTKTELDQNLSKIPSFPFVRLLIDTISPYQKGSLAQVIEFCPSLTSVAIYAVKGLTDTDLLSLMSLKNLVRFYLQKPLRNEVDKIKEIQITFQGGVVPLLKKFGINSMEILNIPYFNFVDIWTILKFCPYLVSLTFNRHSNRVTDLSENDLSLYRNEKERFILQNLETLDCCGSSSSEILHYLWFFPSLTEIYILYCDSFTDEFLQNAAKCHKFQNLKKLELYYCDFVTKEGMDALMTPRNRIQDIRITFCRNLTHAHVYDWHLQAKRENWKFSIYFKNSDIETYYRTDKY